MDDAGNCVLAQESNVECVWDYPRPPRLEDCSRELRVVFGGVPIAASRRSKRILETSHPPVYYFPPADVQMEHLIPSRTATFCEWKGTAAYYDVVVGDHAVADAAWTYPEPSRGFAGIRGYVAFYPNRMDACYVDGERVRCQEGDFYGGWITSDIEGPFKGAPGTSLW
jgi:uncharacterized protein (DUF427 family)